MNVRMTESEVLKYFKDANRKNYMVGVLPKSDIGKCVMQALENQIPKKPIKVDSGVHDYDYDYECPMCRENIDEDEHHCKCGQAIDWSDEDD